MKKILFTTLILTLSYNMVYALDTAIDIHGFVTQGFLKSTENPFIKDTKDGTFQFNEMGLNFSNQITDDLHMGIQLFAYDFGDAGNDKISINYGMASYYFRQWLILDVGISKVKSGFYGDTRDLEMIRPNILLPMGVYPEVYRDSLDSAKGIELKGSYRPDLIDLGVISYCFQYGIIDISQDTGIGKGFSHEFHINAGYSSADKAPNLVLCWETPIPGLRLQGQYAFLGYNLGGTTHDDAFWASQKTKVLEDIEDQALKDYLKENLIVGNVPVDIDGDFEIITCGMEYTRQNLVVTLERSVSLQDFDITLYPGLKNAMPPNPETEPWKNTVLGYYYMLSYRISDWLQLGGYYTVFYPDTDDKRGNHINAEKGLPRSFAWEKDSCLSVRFDFNRNSCLKLEGHYIDGTSQINFMNDQDEAGYDDINRYWYLFAAKFSFNF
ncbi:MAG: hypothetical protein KJ737_26420 [Proteobacteria bacterium]|nr:hypothetical protein [Pseudomonadota bacterium]